ncbi:MAG: hypothetical protein BRD50_08355, partial [Bacteroidetes bacterium SW_11_45_7]
MPSIHYLRQGTVLLLYIALVLLPYHYANGEGSSFTNQVADVKIDLKGEADSPSLILTLQDQESNPLMAADSMYPVQIGDETTSFRFTNGQTIISGDQLPEKGIVYIKPQDQIDTDGKIYYLEYSNDVLISIPFWLSLLPPLIAIAFALIFREVFISLFVGIWAGAFIALGMQPELILKSL